MEYLNHILILISLYAISSMSLNLLVGYTGLVSIAQTAINGIGTYTVAIILTRLGWNFFLALLVGVILSMVASFVIGLVLNKFRDDYYMLATIGFGTIVLGIFRNVSSLTRGPLGIPGIPRPSLFGFEFTSNIYFLVLSVLIFLGVYVIMQKIVHSSYGRVLKAIRDDEEAIKLFGYNTYYYKLSIFVIASGLTSIGGGLYASYISFIDPSSYTIPIAVFVLAGIILGGLANMGGSIIGAMVVVLLPEALRFVGFPPEVAAQMRQLVFGLALILLMLYRPQGLMGKYKL